MTDIMLWALLGWAFVQSWLLQRALKREGALEKRVNILQGAVDGTCTMAALAMEKLGITKDEILKRATEQRLGRPVTPEEAEGLARVDWTPADKENRRQIEDAGYIMPPPKKPD